MADPREQILARLMVVAGAIDPSAGTVYRNDPSLSEADAPFVMVVDGSEDASEGDPVGRDALTPRHVTMTAAVSFIVTEAPTTIGTTMDALRAKLIKAVLSDATLLGYTTNSKGIRYSGCDAAVVQGNEGIIGQIDVSFAFSYIMRPGQLA